MLIDFKTVMYCTRSTARNTKMASGGKVIRRGLSNIRWYFLHILCTILQFPMSKYLKKTANDSTFKPAIPQINICNKILMERQT